MEPETPHLTLPPSTVPLEQPAPTAFRGPKVEAGFLQGSSQGAAIRDPWVDVNWTPFPPWKAFEKGLCLGLLVGGAFMSLSVKEPASLGCWLIRSLVSSRKLGTFSLPSSRGGLEERPPRGASSPNPGKPWKRPEVPAHPRLPTLRPPPRPLDEMATRPLGSQLLPRRLGALPPLAQGPLAPTRPEGL